MPGQLDNRVVVVTGGTGALGSAVVDRLLDAGASVRVPCFDECELEGFAPAARERVRVQAGVDLRDESDAERFYTGVEPLWASINIAGGFAMASIERTSLDDWREMLAMNATTCFLACREAVKRIRAAGGDGGRIVNVAAKPALIPTGGMCAYAASKAAVVSLTVCLAEEVKDEGIWVNAVAPSIMDTPANRRAMPKANHDAWPSVEAVAATVAFLASPANRATRGGIVPVYGRS